MRLYIEGHNHRKGYAISRTWSDEECSKISQPITEEMKPVRFIKSHNRAFALMVRWNRRFATHG